MQYLTGRFAIYYRAGSWTYLLSGITRYVKDGSETPRTTSGLPAPAKPSVIESDSMTERQSATYPIWKLISISSPETAASMESDISPTSALRAVALNIFRFGYT